MLPFRQIGFHKYLFHVVVLQYFFFVSQNSTSCICECYIRVRVIPRGISTNNRRQYRISLYKPIVMNKLHLHEMKHALNFSSHFCMLFLYVHSWKCFWWEHIFSKEKKRVFFWYCLIRPECFQIISLQYENKSFAIVFL